MGTQSSRLAWRIPWAEEPGGLQSVGSQRVGHDLSNLAHVHTGEHFGFYKGIFVLLLDGSIGG